MIVLPPSARPALAALALAACRDIPAPDQSGVRRQQHRGSARWPGLAASQLGVIARSPGRLFLWADGVGVYGSFWVTVVASGQIR